MQAIFAKKKINFCEKYSQIFASYFCIKQKLIFAKVLRKFKTKFFLRRPQRQEILSTMKLVLACKGSWSGTVCDNKTAKYARPHIQVKASQRGHQCGKGKSFEPLLKFSSVAGHLFSNTNIQWKLYIFCQG